MLYNEVQLNVELDGNARYKCQVYDYRPGPGGPELQRRGRLGSVHASPSRQSAISCILPPTGAHHYYDSALSSAILWSPLTIAVSHTIPLGI